MATKGSERYNLRKLRTEDIKDIVVLSFGFFGIGFFIPTYIYIMLNFLLKSSIPKSILLGSFYSELILIAFFKEKILFLFEMTRTAIGRRTPYILVFGTMSAFLLSTIYNLLTVDKNLFSLVFVVITFNFSLFIYALSLLGMLEDKKNYFNRMLLNLQPTLWSIIGAVWSYGYSVRLLTTDSNREIVSHASLLFFFSVFAVAFLIVEDKKYKVELSVSEKAEIYDKFQAKKISWKVLNTSSQQILKYGLAKVLLYQIEFLLPLHAWYLLNIRKGIPTEFDSAKTLYFFVLGHVLNTVLVTFFKNYSKKLDLLGPVSTAFALFIYATTFILPTTGWLFTSVFLVGFLICHQIQKRLGFTLPGIVRFLSEYNSNNETNRFESRPVNLLGVYISVILAGSLIDVIGIQSSSYILGLLIAGLVVIELLTSHAKIKNK
ncbi:hypothetical protein [Fervidobacterium pennivorans]|uniref:hypothetical protein n=1 Tax=Fervidobacterium pennivorans TaxID=93466 RepID=UPI001436ABCC|nr:hypothetical protein [Fervidobacterium pennivorans]QIV79052.1 hypothetical protein HER11_09075 [Fervidobacterium pennivorans subsp. keratinolyticus]